MARSENAHKAAREGIDRDKLYPLAEAVKLVKERAKAKFDETIEIAMNLGVDPTSCRPDGARRGQSAERLRPLGARRACSRAAPRPTRPRPPAPTSSAPRTWSRRCRAAPSTSTAASPRPT